VPPATLAALGALAALVELVVPDPPVTPAAPDAASGAIDRSRAGASAGICDRSSSRAPQMRVSSDRGRPCPPSGASAGRVTASAAGSAQAEPDDVDPEGDDESDVDEEDGAAD
jgi:hypothetical protein